MGICQLTAPCLLAIASLTACLLSGSLDELQELNDDPAKQLEFFETSPYVSLVRDVEQAHRTEAERIARASCVLCLGVFPSMMLTICTGTNLEREPVLEALRKELVTLSERLVQLEGRLQTKHQRYSELASVS